MAPAALKSLLRVIIIFNRPLRGLLSIDSNDFLPMATGIAQVIFLKNLRSLGKCQSSLLSLPIALFVEAATTSDMIILNTVDSC